MAIAFIDATAIRENVVRVQFSTIVNFTGLLEPVDASLPSHWAVTADPTTTGMAGDVARAVGVVGVELAGAADGVADADVGRYVNLLLDRPMTPFPAVYGVGWTAVWAADLLTSSTGSSSIFGVYRTLSTPTIETPRRSRDFASPTDVYELGAFGVDATGDYSFDEGLACLKKRVIRRLMTRKGAFLHLPNYGVGIPYRLKQLATAELLSQLRGEAEQQIGEEPDVLQCRVTISASPDAPGLFRFRVAVKTRIGTAVAFEVPFDAG